MRHLSHSCSKDANRCLLAKLPPYKFLLKIRADPHKNAQFKWTLPEQQLRRRQLWQISAMNEDSHSVDYIVDWNEVLVPCACLTRDRIRTWAQYAKPWWNRTWVTSFPRTHCTTSHYQETSNTVHDIVMWLDQTFPWNTWQPKLSVWINCWTSW